MKRNLINIIKKIFIKKTKSKKQNLYFKNIKNA